MPEYVLDDAMVVGLVKQARPADWPAQGPWPWMDYSQRDLAPAYEALRGELLRHYPVDPYGPAAFWAYEPDIPAELRGLSQTPPWRATLDARQAWLEANWLARKLPEPTHPPGNQVPDNMTTPPPTVVVDSVRDAAVDPQPGDGIPRPDEWVGDPRPGEP